jgi:uncharacterized protein
MSRRRLTPWRRSPESQRPRCPRPRTLLGGMLAVLLAAWPLLLAAQDFEFHAPASPADPATPAAMRDLAERLLPVYQESDPDRYLADLSALQMAAGDFEAANTSRQSLRERQRRSDSGHPIERGAILDIYAHAREIEAEKKIPFAEAFTQAYQEAISRLNDHDAYVIAEWLESLPKDAREDFQALLDEQRSRDSIGQADAVKLIRAYLGFEAAQGMSPLAASLDAKSDAARYAADEDITLKVPSHPEVRVRVVRPKGVTTPMPAVLELSIDPARSSAKEYAAHGYVGVSAFLAPSRVYPLAPFQHDGEEARAVIAWIAKQSWSDGRVAMVGEGYSGFAAWAAAARMPPALKAIATSSPTAPGIDVPMSGGIFQNSAFRWSLQATNMDPSLDASLADDAVWRALNEKWYRSGRRYRDLGLLYGKPNPIFLRWLNHPSYDRFWQTMIPYRREFARITIPVLTTTGYYDDAEPAALYYFSEHLRHNPKADHRLLIGPFDDSVIRHGALVSPMLRDYEVDPAARIDLRELRYQWLDHVFKDAAMPAQLADRVNYEVMGANEWRHAPTLDAMAVGFERLYLDAAAAGEGHRLARRKSQKLAAVAQTVPFKDRRDAAWLPPTDLISRSLVTRNAVLYATEPFTKPMELSGLIAAHLDFAVNKMDLDLNLSLYERKANGDYVRLFNPAFEQRLSYAEDRGRRRLLKSGERQQIAFKSERLTSRRLDKGSRLVMVLRVAKRPDREINYGTGNDVSEETMADGTIPLKVRWFNDSFLEVPLRAAP